MTKNIHFSMDEMYPCYYYIDNAEFNVPYEYENLDLSDEEVETLDNLKEKAEQYQELLETYYERAKEVSPHVWSI